MVNFKIRSNQTLSATTLNLLNVTQQQVTEIAVGQQPFLTGQNYNNNFALQGNTVDNIYGALAAAGAVPPILPGRTITFNNATASTNIDLYLTEGGTNPQPLTKIATIAAGGMFVRPISDTQYNFSGNFTTMPAGVPPPQFNAGTTLTEFGLNQVWHGAVPPLRDTFDISTVPPGIDAKVNDGPRSAAVQLSRASGFSVQQSFNYNIGSQIIPPAGALATQTVTVTQTNGDSPDSIGFPDDTAFPKQQTGVAAGNYTVNFMDPVVTVP